MSLPINPDDIHKLIRSAKITLKQQGGNHKATFDAMSASLQQEIQEIQALRDRGASVVPDIRFQDIVAGDISPEQKDLIRKRGCAVIRNTFPQAQAEEWNQRIGAYVAENGYYETPDKGLDKYFSSLQSSKPQILSVYWSKPQMEARQHENMAQVRRFLNRLWTYEHQGQTVFDPDRECTYADRTRRREPGDNSLGLKPHMDGGSVERWLDAEGFHKVYRHLISGNWEAYNPFDAAYRTETREIPSPAVCSMFRTFQGWTALTPQGPHDGTLQLIPSSRVMGWMFLRALQDDVPEDNLCDAAPARALLCSPQWHRMALDGLTSIPHMRPGDTVWWHPDVIHAVEDRHQGEGYSNVIYIGAAPWCQKNADYLKKQAPAFLKGKSAPDFAPENYEVEYHDRAGVADLSLLGKQQMGLEPW